MTEQTRYKLVAYNEEYAKDAVEMWRNSKAKAIGIEEAHTIEDHLAFLNEILARESTVSLALLESNHKVVGLMATDGEHLNQLYVHNDYQRIGIGSKLLNLAKETSRGKLRLFTFEVNLGRRYSMRNTDFESLGADVKMKKDLQIYFMSGPMIVNVEQNKRLQPDCSKLASRSSVDR